MIHELIQSNCHNYIIRGLNRLQNGHDALYIHYREIEDVKSGTSSRGFDRDPPIQAMT